MQRFGPPLHRFWQLCFPRPSYISRYICFASSLSSNGFVPAPQRPDKQRKRVQPGLLTPRYCRGPYVGDPRYHHQRCCCCCCCYCCRPRQHPAKGKPIRRGRQKSWWASPNVVNGRRRGGGDDRFAGSKQGRGTPKRHKKPRRRGGLHRARSL